MPDLIASWQKCVVLSKRGNLFQDIFCGLAKKAGTDGVHDLG